MKKFRGYTNSVDTRLREQGFERFYYEDDTDEYIYITKTDDGYIVVDTDMCTLRFTTTMDEDEFTARILSDKDTQTLYKYSEEIGLFEALGYEF